MTLLEKIGTTALLSTLVAFGATASKNVTQELTFNGVRAETPYDQELLEFRDSDRRIILMAGSEEGLVEGTLYTVNKTDYYSPIIDDDMQMWKEAPVLNDREKERAAFKLRLAAFEKKHNIIGSKYQ